MVNLFNIFGKILLLLLFAILERGCYKNGTFRDGSKGKKIPKEDILKYLPPSPF